MIKYYQIGDYVYFIVSMDEINWHPGMFKPESPKKPIAKKIIHIEFVKQKTSISS